MSTRQASFMMVILALIALYLMVHLVQADPPPRSVSSILLESGSGAVNFQGVLTDNAGNPVTDGDHSLTFALYDVATEGTPLWAETQTLATANGLFNARLGAVTALNPDHFDGRDLWLGIQVATDPEMSPRLPITSVFYARSLTPGGVMRGNLDNAATFSIENSSLTGIGLRVEGLNNSSLAVDVLGEMHATGDVEAGNDVIAGSDIQAGGDLEADNIHVNSDVIADRDVAAGDDVYASDEVNANSVTAVGDVRAGDDVYADDRVNAGTDVNAGRDIIADGRVYAYGDVYAVQSVTSEGGVSAAGHVTAGGRVIADDDVIAGDEVIASNDITAGDIVHANNEVQAGNHVRAGNDVDAVDDVFAGDDVRAGGDVFAGGVKPAIIQTASFGQRLTYAVEGAQVWFVDQGQGQLQKGVATITLDPIFLETVTIDDEQHPMLVQITLTGDSLGVYVAQQTATGFTVRELQGGKSDATFNWQVSALRKGYEDTRLEPFEEPEHPRDHESTKPEFSVAR